MKRRHLHLIRISLYLLCTLTACISLTNCSDDPPTPPPPPPPPVRDTMSHEFTWELYNIGDTFGQMEDVWAIDDDHAIAVGRFVWLDSTGYEVHDSTKNTVELFYGLQTKYNISDDGKYGLMNSCYAHTTDTVWVGTGIPFRKTVLGGVQWFKPNDVQRPPWGGLVTKMWGTKYTDDVYLTCGNVIQRVKDGQIKTILKPEEHPNITFYDIWGDEDGDVMAVGLDTDVHTNYLYQIKQDNSWQIIHQSAAVFGGIWGFNGLWYTEDMGCLIEWDGKVFRTLKSGLGNTYQIRGNHENDIFISYQNCHVIHWNGSTYEDIYHDEYGKITATGFSVSKNAVYFCGIAASQQPVILVGRRVKK